MAIKTLSQAITAFRTSRKAQFLTLICIVIASGLVFQMAEAQPSFCNSCHEMNFHYSTWQNSTHGNSASCLDCHSEPGISGQIDQKIRGLQELVIHITGNYQLPIRNSTLVKNEQCLSCHPESANIPDKNIDIRHNTHLEAGLKCVDCHSNIVHNEPGEPKTMPLSKCDSCHQKHQEFPMTDDHSELKCSVCHVNGIYEKIEATCESCHSSPVNHIYNISTKCEACHTLEGWGQAIGKHTELPLTKEHSNVTCVKCHPNAVYVAKSTLCESCHNLPVEHFKTTDSCESCHTTGGWTPADYDHSFYKLENKHQTINCTQCHTDHQYVDTPKKCELCHTTSNDHEYSIDTRCEACHDTKGWKTATSHLSFPLTEQHSNLQCSDCHTDLAYKETPNTCGSCHTLPSEHFNTPKFNTTISCDNCHTSGGWTSASFDHSFYPLSGGHSSASCNDCHATGQYAGTTRTCSNCHNAPSYHPVQNNNNCGSCHSNGAWKPASYTHTGFALTGAHASLACSSCHKGGTYTGLSSTCESCHSPPANHPAGDVGNCGSCHSTTSFTGASLDHSGFTLTGAHASLACSSCHKGGTFTGLSTACVSCHQTPSTHSGLSQNCFSCHSGNTFSPSTYLHDQVGPHVPSGGRRLSCVSCHRPSYSVASCTGSGCHSSNNPRG